MGQLKRSRNREVVLTSDKGHAYMDAEHDRGLLTRRCVLLSKLYLRVKPGVTQLLLGVLLGALVGQ
jgi:hypothetical protein